MNSQWKFCSTFNHFSTISWTLISKPIKGGSNDFQSKCMTQIWKDIIEGCNFKDWNSSMGAHMRAHMRESWVMWSDFNLGSKEI